MVKDDLLWIHLDHGSIWNTFLPDQTIGTTCAGIVLLIETIPSLGDDQSTQKRNLLNLIFSNISLLFNEKFYKLNGLIDV